MLKIQERWRKMFNVLHTGDAKGDYVIKAQATHAKVMKLSQQMILAMQWEVLFGDIWGPKPRRSPRLWLGLTGD